MYGATIGRLGILGIEAATNQACCALARPRGAHPKFVYYALLAGRVVLIEQASGGGQPNINQEKIRAFKIPVPPVHEQRAIVDFIERETAKIDALLDRQATFRAKLQEHRDALLSHLLEQDYPSVRLRFIAALNPSKGEISHLDPALEVSFVPMEAVGEDSSLDSSRLKPISEVSTGYTYFRDGDILIAKITPCFENGKATLARGLTGGVGFGSTEFHVVRPRECFDPRYAFYLLWSSAFRDIATASMYGAGGQKRVPTDFLADFPIPLPPLAEQRAIADRLDDQTAKIDGLIAKQDDFIERLRERRAALITAAVTGQIAIAANIAAEAAA
jgi:type I restriction enzyme S subunit